MYGEQEHFIGAAEYHLFDQQSIILYISAPRSALMEEGDNHYDDPILDYATEYKTTGSECAEWFYISFVNPPDIAIEDSSVQWHCSCCS